MTKTIREHLTTEQGDGIIKKLVDTGLFYMHQGSITIVEETLKYGQQPYSIGEPISPLEIGFIGPTHVEERNVYLKNKLGDYYEIMTDIVNNKDIEKKVKGILANLDMNEVWKKQGEAIGEEVEKVRQARMQSLAKSHNKYLN